jgi:hypothetical protein
MNKNTFASNNRIKSLPARLLFELLKLLVLRLTGEAIYGKL